jgi:TonB-dependent starch-binding outer membrane protein SusC
MKSRVLLSTVIFLSIIFLPSYGQRSEKGKNRITIKGTVLDAGKKAVSGAYVFVDGHGIGVMTDENGKFKVRSDGSARDILVAAPGTGFAMKPAEEKLEFILSNPTETIPDFAMKYIDDNKAKAEKRKPKKMNTYTDIYQMIRHEVPGVLVNGRSIVVQQPNSFFGGTTPLFVVNGVRVTSIDYINPQEVKSIQLLKGSYANIYGDEGANGVISITLISGGDRK